MRRGNKHILTLPTLLFLAVSLLCVNTLDARTRTTRKNLRSTQVPVAVMESDDGLLPDSLQGVDPKAVTLKGYSKRASDAKESFFITNNTSHRMSAVRLLLRYTAMNGEMLTQPMANTLSLQQNLMILCGHYKGVDERIREHFITKEISIGDYVLTGGELAAAVICDTVVRLIPGVIGDEQFGDSFQDGLLAPPEYTRPPEFRGWRVPDILLSGNHAKIEQWRYEQALQRTQERRPDLIKAISEK